MKQGACETYGHDLFELIEGDLSAGRQDALHGHLQGCPACAAELSHLQDLCHALTEMGAAYRAADVLPESLVTQVLMEAEQVRRDQLMAFLDGELGQPETLGLRNRLKSRPILQVELEELREAHEALQAYAADSTAPALPEMDLVDAVMARIAEAPAGEVVELREHRELKQLEEALFALGTESVAAAPEVDLVDAVMRGLKQPAAAAPATIVPLKARPKTTEPLRQPKRRSTFAWAPLAAAACLLLALGLVLYRAQEGQVPVPPRERVAKSDPVSPVVPPDIHLSPGAVTGDPGVVPSAPQAESLPVQTPPKLAQHEPRRSRYEGATLQNVLNARRKAMMKDAEALASMAEWSSLSEEEARALLEQLAWSTDAVLGASQFLRPEEAAAVLQAAVASKPEDPYLRYALAKNLEELQRYDEGREQLAAWAGLDPENSLAIYMDAEILFQQGRSDEALAMLDMANTMTRASVYASESAQHHRQALISNGMDPDVASVIAASTAGTNEYSDLVALGEQMLEYGKQYEAAGDYATAEQIYQAVQQMGLQLDQNALYGNIRLAGTDIQMGAVDALMGLYDVFGSPEGQYLLETAYEGLSNSLTEIADIFGDYTQLFDSLSTEELMNVTNVILHQGDAGVYPSYFPR